MKAVLTYIKDPSLIIQRILIKATSVTRLTVAATLSLSLGTNLIASLWLWSDHMFGYNDVVLIWASWCAIYSGYVLFTFLEDASDVMREREIYMASHAEGATLRERLARFVSNRL